MSFKNLICDSFQSPPELVTGKRYILWKRVGIAGGVCLLLLMIAISVFGSSKNASSSKEYRSVSSDDVSKKGTIVLTAGNYEVRKNGSLSNGGVSTSRGRGSRSDVSQIVSKKNGTRSDSIIPAGTKIEAVLEGDLNSQLSEGPIVTRIIQNFVFKGRVLFPENLTILGRLNEAQSENRIAIHFDQFVFPNGQTVQGSGIAMMPDGSPGVVGELHSNQKLKIAGALGTSFISGAAAGLQNSTANAFGIAQTEGSTRNAILNGLAQTSLDQAKRFGEDAKNTKGFITLDSGARVVIYIEHEMDLSGVESVH